MKNSTTKNLVKNVYFQICKHREINGIFRWIIERLLFWINLRPVSIDITDHPKTAINYYKLVQKKKERIMYFDDLHFISGRDISCSNTLL